METWLANGAGVGRWWANGGGLCHAWFCTSLLLEEYTVEAASGLACWCRERLLLSVSCVHCQRPVKPRSRSIDHSMVIMWHVRSLERVVNVISHLHLSSLVLWTMLEYELVDANSLPRYPKDRVGPATRSAVAIVQNKNCSRCTLQ